MTLFLKLFHFLILYVIDNQNHENYIILILYIIIESVYCSSKHRLNLIFLTISTFFSWCALVILHKI